ncbi:MAG: nucleoside deaminase [Alphaproteobacteria bacterium]|nr:nucleoside deaminase [Alphaproteobacteria bacterium]
MQKNANAIIANEKIDDAKLRRAKKIILNLYDELPKYIARGHGPFLAAIYDGRGHLVAKSANTVIKGGCSHNHAEMNAIHESEKILKTYDLSGRNLSLYITAEPCMMCIGGIMWSGIKNVYFGVLSRDVENITGFDEGFKPDWLKEFKRRKITVYGNIEPEIGKNILQDYVNQKHIIYKPKRK